MPPSKVMSAQSSDTPSDSLATRLRQLRRDRRAQAAGSESSARELVLVAFGLPIVVVVALTLIVSLTVVAAGGGFGGIGVAVGSAWLVVHQIPLTIAGVTVGALPLLPTLILVGLAARAVTPAIGERRSVYELGALFAASICGPLLITALAMAVVMDGESVLPVQSPTPLAAFGATALVHGVATAIAVIGARWREWAHAQGMPDERVADLARGTRLGGVAVLALVSSVGVMIGMMLLVRYSAVADLIGEARGVDGYLGLVVLSICYLPNLAVAGAAALVGADVNVGLASLTLLDAHGGAVPPLPLFAVLPDGTLGRAGLLGYLVTAGIVGYVGWKCRDHDLMRNVRLVGLASSSAALIMALATWAASGDLGELGTFGARVPVAAACTFGVVGVGGFAVALVYAALPQTRAARASAVGAMGADEDYRDEDSDDEDYRDYSDEDTDVVGEFYDDSTDGDVYDEYGDDEYADDEYESEYNEYYLDDLADDDFTDVDTTRIPPVPPPGASRRPRSRGFARDDYEDADFLDEDETEVTPRL